MESCIHELITFPMEVLILRVPFFEEKHIGMALRAQRRFHLASVIVMAREVNPAARSKAAALKNFKLLQEPMEVQDLVSIIPKLRSQDPALQSLPRLHPRARRRDLVQIIDSSGQAHRATFVDFAQMGARLAISNMSSAKFRARESVQIHYGSSSEPGKVHRIEAKIVWSKGGLASGSSQTAGVRFIAAY